MNSQHRTNHIAKVQSLSVTDMDESDFGAEKDLAMCQLLTRQCCL